MLVSGRVTMVLTCSPDAPTQLSLWSCPPLCLSFSPFNPSLSWLIEKVPGRECVEDISGD